MSKRLNWCTQFPYIRLKHPDHEVWRPDHEVWRTDGWTSSARLALSRIASRQKHTSSRWVQLSSHICVLERNLSTCRTLKGIQMCCWEVQTNASWNSSKVLDTEEGPEGKFSSSRQMMLGQLSVKAEYHVVWTIQRIRFLWLEICAKSSRSISLKKKTSENGWTLNKKHHYMEVILSNRM